MCEVTTVSNEEFDRNISGAMKASEKGPVFITDGGRLAHVLLSVEAYRRLTGEGAKMSELLSHDAAAEIDLPLPTFRDLAVPADLS